MSSRCKHTAYQYFCSEVKARTQFINISHSSSSPADVTSATPRATLPGRENETNTTLENGDKHYTSSSESFEWWIELLCFAGGVIFQGDWCSMFMGYFRNNGDKWMWTKDKWAFMDWMIMEGHDVRNDHINVDSWWSLKRGEVIMVDGFSRQKMAPWIIYAMNDVILYEILCMLTLI